MTPCSRLAASLALLLACACFPRPAPAQQTVDTTDFGPFIAVTVDAPWGNPVMKGVVVRLGPNQDAAVVYDTDLLRMAGGWVGIGQGWQNLMEYRSTSFSANHGTPNVPKGEMKFATGVGPGWARPGSEGVGDFADPRTPQSEGPKMVLGPLPKDWAHYKGLYLNGERVVLAYTVGACDVLETPGLAEAEGQRAFTRSIHLGSSDKPMTLLVASLNGATGGVAKPGEALADNADKAGPAGGTVAVLNENGDRPGTHTAVAAAGAPEGAAWSVENGRVHLTLPARQQPAAVKLVVWNGPKADLPKFKALADAAAAQPAENLPDLCKGGPPRWTADLTTKGVVGAPESAYVVDTLTLPYENPYKSVMRTCGVDFFSDKSPQRLAVSTIGGDVWVVSGVDDRLESLKWKRFATGLYQPLGLKIVEDKVYTVGRDQITRLHDLNNDGEADFYENFNSDTFVTDNYHEFCLDLQTDKAGNFYYGKGAPWGPDPKSAHQGCMIKVSKDGRTMEVFATGLRAPNGLGMGPNDELTFSDNQGHWIPASKISLVKQGGFYGMMQMAHRDPAPTDFDKPILWLPQSMDNSSGGQAWAPPGDKFGPLAGHLFHMSYGMSRLFAVMTEQVDGVTQAAAVPLPLQFESSGMRARFSPHDGQMYLCGLKGWQTNAQKDGALHRVRYDPAGAAKNPFRLPTEFHAAANGLFLTFANPLDRADAADAGNWAVEQWNYKWSGDYGSPEFSLKNPGQAGHDEVAVKSAKVSADGKSVWLETDPAPQPVMQLKVSGNVKDEKGVEFNFELYGTVNKVGAERGL